MTKDLRMGMTHRESRVFSQEEVDGFSALTGDHNFVHKAGQPSYAPFDGPVVHGVLVMGAFSKVLGINLPGPGTVLLGLEVRFSSPLYVGQEAVLSAKILEKHAEKPIYKVETSCSVKDGEGERLVCTGLATVLFKGAP